MSSYIFSASYVLLGALLFWESYVLIRIWRNTSRAMIERQKRNAAVIGGPPVGARVPKFRAKHLDSPSMLTQKDFKGKSGALVFMKMQTFSEGLAQFHNQLVQQQLSRFDGRIAAVCVHCSEESRDAYRRLFANEERIAFVGDEDRALTRRFGIVRFPTVVTVNASGRVDRVGVTECLGR